MTTEATRCITPVGTLSYPHLHEAQAPKDGKGKAKFSAALVFDAGTDLAPLKAAIAAAGVAKYGDKFPELLRIKALKLPLRDDAEAKGYPAGSTFINVRTERPPQIVYSYADAEGKPAAMPQDKIRDEMYPGAKVRASLNAFTYDTSGNKGISFALNNMQKVGEGERLDNRVNATSEFTADLNAVPASLEGLF